MKAPSNHQRRNVSRPVSLTRGPSARTRRRRPKPFLTGKANAVGTYRDPAEQHWKDIEERAIRMKIGEKVTRKCELAMCL